MSQSPTTAAPPASLLSRLGAVAQDIKLSHSLFALPFALLATFLAAAWAGRLPRVGEAVLIVACMVLARTVAMTANRWADAKLDATNPRTVGRAIPSGRLSRRFVAAVAVACAAGFVVAAGGFYLLYANPWPLLLSPAVLAWLAFYSFTKRFTWLCHIVLGSALAMSPIAASIAIEPAFLAQSDPWLLAGMVTCWVAGFDVIYALQDVQVDRETGLYSMPSRLGVAPALWVSRGLHLVAATLLAVLALTSGVLGIGFAVGVVLVAGLLILEHALIWRSATKHLDVAFLTVNGVISVLLGTLGIIDCVLAVG